MKRKTVEKFAKGGGTIVIGMAKLQESYDLLKSGGGLLLHIPNGPYPVTDILLVEDSRLDEIALEVGATRH